MASQRAEGWLLVPDRYDDGGFSGGTLERPALKRLLADIEAGKVDVVVVYKIDRLSRSLMDFSRLVEVFDQPQGHVRLGHAVVQHHHVHGPPDLQRAAVLCPVRTRGDRRAHPGQVRGVPQARACGWVDGRRWAMRSGIASWSSTRWMRSSSDRSSSAFLKSGSATTLARELIAENVRNKYGKLIDKGILYKLLSNPVYIGVAVHKGVSYPGEHVGIIDRKVWDKVQARFQKNPRKRAGVARAQTPRC